MSNVLKGKLPYASLGKIKKYKQEETSALGGKENDCIYETILSGMNGTEKDYISDLIRAKRRREEQSTLTRNLSDEDIELSNKMTRQPFLRMNSPKLKHVQSLDQVTFLDEQSSCKHKSTNASIVMGDKVGQRKQEGETFIGSLDGYINKLENTGASKAKGQDSNRDYQKKYKHLAEIYMDHINSSKQKQQKLVHHIKKLKKYVQELQQKLGSNSQKEREFAVLWKRREDQFGILLGIQHQLKQHAYSRDLRSQKLSESSALELQSYEEPDCNIRHTIKFNPEQVRRKSRHTVNYY